MSTNSELPARRNAAVPRGVANAHPVFAVHAENSTIWDVEGKKYIDFAGGIAVLNTGHRHPKVMAAVAEQLSHFSHTCFQVTPYENCAHRGPGEDHILHHRRRGTGKRHQAGPRRHRALRRHHLRRRLSWPHPAHHGDDR